MGVNAVIILFDHSKKSFFPGQVVSGKIMIDCDEEVKTEGVKVNVDGECKVQWTEQETRNNNSGNNSGSNTVEKTISDRNVLLEMKSYVFGNGKDTVVMPVGQNMYPFQFTLPLNLPSSYKGAYGSVQYKITATVKRSWRFDDTAKSGFTVNAILDLNKEHGADARISIHKEKTVCCCCCASGPIIFDLEIPRSGFVPGEGVDIGAKIKNGSSRTINSVKVSLYQTATFRASGQTKSNSQEVARAEKCDNPLEPGDTDEWNEKLLKIPAVPPTRLGGCRLIDVQYELKIEVRISGLTSNITASAPVILGTIPLKSLFSSYGVPASTEVEDFRPCAPEYPDLPPPEYHDAMLDRPPPIKKKTNKQIVKESRALLKRQASINSHPSEKEDDFTPTYATYGWNANVTK